MSTDVNRDGLGTGPTSVDEPTTDQPGPTIKLRHVAGLTAGQTLPLTAGRFHFGPLRSSHGGLVAGTPDAVSFDLTIHDDGETVLTAGQEPVAVEGVIISRPVTLDDGDVVQLMTDHFVVEAEPSGEDHGEDNGVDHGGAKGGDELARPVTVVPRPVDPPRTTKLTGWLLLFAAVIVLGVVLAFTNGRLIGISLLGLAGVIATLLLRLRRNERATEARSVAVDNARMLLFSQVVEHRKAAASALRGPALTPAAVAESAARRSEPSTTAVTIASGDQPWDPPVEVERAPGWDHRSVVDDLSFLPAIPYSVDLDQGAIAILGPRSATLAVARHIVTTALYLAGPETGAEVDTEIPADWRWLLPENETIIRILDHVRGSVGPRTIALYADREDLERKGFSSAEFTHVMEVNDAGTADITTAEGTTTGFVPHGITETHAGELLEMLGRPAPERVALDATASTEPDHAGSDPAAVDDSAFDHTTFGDTASEAASAIDLTIFDTDRLLVTGPLPSRHRDVLATAALHQADLHPDRSLYILDRGDRALIRLAQLDNCARYTTIDQLDSVTQMVQDLETMMDQPAEHSSLMLAPDLWNAIEFYRDTGHRPLADRIEELIAKMQLVPMAASATEPPAAAPSFLVWIETGLEATADVHGADGDTVIDLESLPGIDLTGSVARLTTIRHEEIQP